MSRIGKKPIVLPEGVEAEVKGGKVLVKGPRGSLSLQLRPEVKVELKEGKIIVSLAKRTKKSNALWGLTRALLANMVEGVVKGYEKKLEIKGLGFKANLEGNILSLSVGFSHQVKMEIPDDIKVSVQQKIITVSGIDKNKVTQFAALIRKVKPPEPYKGKGIRYLGEVIRRKVGKKAATGAG